MRIGLLRETKIPADTRVPLTPKQCRMITAAYPGTEILVQPSPFRCFTDEAYRSEGVKVQENLGSCDILMGIKEVSTETLIAEKTYLFFSHTIKKQSHNRKLLRTVLDKHIRLVDYEVLTEGQGIRIIGFGRWAGLIGSYHGLRAMCMRLGINELPLPQECPSLDDLVKRAGMVQLPPIRVTITGDGRVAAGSVEMMKAFGIQEITEADYLNNLSVNKPVYVQLDPSKYCRNKTGKPFDLHHFFAHPQDYESNFARFCDKTDLLIMAAYWDPRAPVLFVAQQARVSSFSIKVIADITCDLNGSVPSTHRTTDFEQPYYDYNRFTGNVAEAFSDPSNITVMAIDNLPCGLPKEASEDFGSNLSRKVIPLFIKGDPEGVIERATIAENGCLTRYYNYLSDWVGQQD